MFHQDIQTPRSGLKKRGAASFFLTDFEVFGYQMKHSFEFLIWFHKPFIILGEIQSKSSQNFMLIKIRYLNHRHCGDFLCFLFMNCIEFEKEAVIFIYSPIAYCQNNKTKSSKAKAEI